jgi:hypothetical protein
MQHPKVKKNYNLYIYLCIYISMVYLTALSLPEAVQAATDLDDKRIMNMERGTILDLNRGYITVLAWKCRGKPRNSRWQDGLCLD